MSNSSPPFHLSFPVIPSRDPYHRGRPNAGNQRTSRIRQGRQTQGKGGDVSFAQGRRRRLGTPLRCGTRHTHATASFAVLCGVFLDLRPESWGSSREEEYPSGTESGCKSLIAVEVETKNGNQSLKTRLGAQVESADLRRREVGPWTY